MRRSKSPRPADDQVLIRVHASSINPLTGTSSAAHLPSFACSWFAHAQIETPWRGLAGVVEAVGRNVHSLKPGDAVFGTANGAFAEFACSSAASLALKPENLTWEQAASAPIAGITALQGLRDMGKLVAGQRVLINGAAGGVGTFAVQIARSLGARVTAVCSTRNVELVRSIGADEVIDYTLENFIHQAQRYDVFFDLVGNKPLSACLRVLEPKGIYIGCGGGGPDRRSIELLGPLFQSLALGPFTTKKMPGLLAKVNAADLNLLADLMRSGKVTPVLDRSYALAETADAVRYVELLHARGKVAISVP